MIDPVLFKIQLGNFTLAIHWYGIIVVTAVIIAAWLASKEVKRRGENPEKIWDMLPWLLLIGVIGARLWYVANATLGGSTYYLEKPAAILNIPEGGLHIFGGFIFGGLAFIIYAYLNKLNNGVAGFDCRHIY
jgi:phosphatidylglycerol:prolipoprotein diacylglycerol transferase